MDGELSLAACELACDTSYPHVAMHIVSLTLLFIRVVQRYDRIHQIRAISRKRRLC